VLIFTRADGSQLFVFEDEQRKLRTSKHRPSSDCIDPARHRAVLKRIDELLGHEPTEDADDGKKS
jgi:hypothetical protein